MTHSAPVTERRSQRTMDVYTKQSLLSVTNAAMDDEEANDDEEKEMMDEKEEEEDLVEDE